MPIPLLFLLSIDLNPVDTLRHFYCVGRSDHLRLIVGSVVSKGDQLFLCLPSVFVLDKHLVELLIEALIVVFHHPCFGLSLI